MATSFSRTFDDYVNWTSLHAPYALVHNSWVRLDRALREYVDPITTPSSPSMVAVEQAESSPSRWGPEQKERVRQLHAFGERVARLQERVSSGQAKDYAIEVNLLIGVLALDESDRDDDRSQVNRPLRPALGLGWWRPQWVAQGSARS